MIRVRIRKLINALLFVSISTMLLCPLYLYFSHDIDGLNSKYPSPIISGSSAPRYELVGERPKHWVTLKEISPYAAGAIVISEDWAFYQHSGIDLNQIEVALQDILNSGKVRGASTISQQMIKNVFLTSERTLLRKLHELILTQKAERSLTKERILEAYLNSIEFGPDIYGIKNATLHYFNKPPAAITPREGAFLAMLLPNPKRYYVSFKKKELTPFAIERIETILDKMRVGKVITEAQFNEEINKKFIWESLIY